MNDFVCGAATVLVSWAAFSQASKAQKANEIGKARLWLLVSVPAGVIAATQIAAMISGLSS
jgi:hypothetical protein